MMIKYLLRSSLHLREFLLAPLNIGTPLKGGKSMMRRHKSEPVKIGFAFEAAQMLFEYL